MKNWKDRITKLIPYEAGEQITGSDVIKLNANENPYPPSPKVYEALTDFDYGTLKNYPSLGKNSLEKAVADYHGLKPENVLCGNSSDEVLALSFRAFFGEDHKSHDPVLFPDITYSFYPVWCEFYGISFKEIPLTESFEVNIDDYTDVPEDTENAGGIIIPNPNAPTGIGLDYEKTEKLLAAENQSSVVIVDEAYADFGDFTALPFIRKYDNLLITKTLSKSRSLAGLRVGYALGSEELINALGAAMHSFNAYPLSRLAIDLAEASIRDEKYFNDTIRKIKKTRESTAVELKSRGFKLTDSQANFMFISHENINAEDLYRYLFDKRILVRHFTKARINNYLRVTVGTDEEMEKFLYVIDEYMEDRNVI